MVLFLPEASLSQIWWHVYNPSHSWEAEAGRLLQIEASLGHSSEFKATKTLAHEKGKTNRYRLVYKNGSVQHYSKRYF